MTFPPDAATAQGRPAHDQGEPGHAGPGTPQAERVRPGTVIADRYELTAKVGDGGHGTVWRAHDRLLRRDVAVKEVTLSEELPPEERERRCERTLREAQAAASLSHPSVVRVFDVITEGGRPWIVMELLQARSLADIIASSGRLPPRVVAKIGLALTGALEAAHAAGILHRDVKPGNVLISSDGRCVLSDFGAAAGTTGSGHTAPGMVLGSAHYIAPERAIGGSAEPASDLFSLGVTLYAALEGRPPFDRGETTATMHAVVNDPPEAPRHAGPLAPVLAGLLEKDPSRRYQTAAARGAFTALLSGQLASEDGGHPVSGGPVSGGPISGIPSSGFPPPVTGVPASGGPRVDSTEPMPQPTQAHTPSGPPAGPLGPPVAGTDPMTGLPYGPPQSAPTPPPTTQAFGAQTPPSPPPPAFAGGYQPAGPTGFQGGPAGYGAEPPTYGGGAPRSGDSSPKKSKLGVLLGAGIGVIVIALIATFALGVFSGEEEAPPPDNAGEEDEAFESELFTYPEGLFTAEVPKGWNPDDGDGSVVNVRNPEDDTQWLRFNVTGETNPKGVLEGAIPGLADQFEGYADEDLVEIEIGGMSGWMLEYSGNWTQSGQDRHALWALVSDGTKGYHVYLSVPAEKFEESRPYFEKAVETFTLADGE